MAQPIELDLDMAAQDYIAWITIVYFTLPLDGSRGALTGALSFSGEKAKQRFLTLLMLGLLFLSIFFFSPEVLNTF
jgi:hypothetical protein